MPPIADSADRRLSISFTPADGRCRLGRVFFGADLTFSVDGLIGTCNARVTGASGAWIVKAVKYGNVDLLDGPTTFENGQQLRDIEVILTDKRTELTLQVSDDSGRPTRDYVALVFSVDRERWRAGSRYVRTYVAPADDTIGAGERTRSGVCHLATTTSSPFPTSRPTRLRSGRHLRRAVSPRHARHARR